MLTADELRAVMMELAADTAKGRGFWKLRWGRNNVWEFMLPNDRGEHEVFSAQMGEFGYKEACMVMAIVLSNHSSQVSMKNLLALNAMTRRLAAAVGAVLTRQRA